MMKMTWITGIALSTAFLIYDRELKPAGRMEGDYFKLVGLLDEGQEQSLAAFGSNGALSIIDVQDSSRR